ncbi:response regulator transcription factor [Alloyangia pacifica]|uniref:DNA-binding response regulator, OmpR family, contains REC and winged-helix (WHTH) domain n=1 Tax=Alloyangia pacifica TaxID=311180 RepID=A0A1I6SRE7_9RHOB|nr:response regulator transcription factor [Alloyangia pacifica]SDG86122.1 DNA-binding response regulator, OmpR family, contains REC and winged-helix (wHTH) domain [Alloyangia pacifica]SFS79541.1 DNA-binding response regulator, OmpR family, contains REC and winged-helix (wHTH) domain [Alloyangia pacifica]
MSELPRLLVVDDDPEICSALARGLGMHGYAVETCNRADLALARLSAPGFDAAVIDVMLGADSGIDLVRAARAAGAQLPIVMLSALSEVEHRAAGLAAGADDYVVKPFAFDELVARLQVQQHRAAALRPVPARLHAADHMLVTATREVQLTDREFALLSLLAAHSATPLSRGEIFDRLWAGDSSSENVVDVYIGYLRRKLKPAADFGFEIVTIRQKGFCLEGVAPTC